MKLNFSLKRAWGELINQNGYIRDIVSIAVLIIVSGIVDYNIKVQIFAPILTFIYSAYLVLIANNIINDDELDSSKMLHNPDKKKNIISIGFNLIGIGIIYTIIALLIFVIIAGNYVFLSHIKSVFWVVGFTILLVLITIALALFISTFPQLLFAEKLDFKNSLNIKKAIISMKFAWLEYLISWLIAGLIIISIACFGALLISFIFSLIHHIHWNMTIFSVLKKSHLTKLTGPIIGNVGNVFAIYFSTHLCAQAYKYSLTKMNSPAS